MIPQDLVNSILESLGSVFILLSIIKLRKEKLVRGISYIHVGFFSAWGVWNIYYYPFLNQWLSFAGGILTVLANTTYLLFLIYYVSKEKAGGKE